jgi:hypothetical protein
MAWSAISKSWTGCKFTDPDGTNIACSVSKRGSGHRQLPLCLVASLGASIYFVHDEWPVRLSGREQWPQCVHAFFKWPI